MPETPPDVDFQGELWSDDDADPIEQETVSTSPADVESAETIPGPITDLLAERARRHGIYVHGGSIYEVRPGDPGLYNTAVVIDPQGEIIARYSKIHMFDVVIEGDRAYRESDTVTPGNEIVLTQIDDLTVGLAICYDLRFPELFRSVATEIDAAILVANWPERRRPHWDVLTRARAIENQCYLVAVNRTGTGDGVEYDGGSVAYDPWGEPVGIGGGGSTPRVVDIDPARVKLVRARYPFLRELELAREPSVPQFH